MSLDDFIVVDNDDPKPDMTLRSFFTLNNSYYQKSFFTNNLLPIQCNQEIKYAFEYKEYEKIFDEDINKNIHGYVTENGNVIEVINDDSDSIFIIDNDKYISTETGDFAIYYKYAKVDNTYNKIDNAIYYKNKTDNIYKLAFNGSIAIVDKYDNYIFAADEYYTKDSNGKYIPVKDDKYRDGDNTYDKIFNFGEYYIYENYKWNLVFEVFEEFVKKYPNNKLEFIKIKYYN